jgi:hypothetical protein
VESESFVGAHKGGVTARSTLSCASIMTKAPVTPVKGDWVPPPLCFKKP